MNAKANYSTTHEFLEDFDPDEQHIREMERQFEDEDEQ